MFADCISWWSGTTVDVVWESGETRPDDTEGASMVEAYSSGTLSALDLTLGWYIIVVPTACFAEFKLSKMRWKVS
jgi:hypothetical protein